MIFAKVGDLFVDFNGTKYKVEKVEDRNLAGSFYNFDSIPLPQKVITYYDSMGQENKVHFYRLDSTLPDDTNIWKADQQLTFSN
jgi:hypothetical protein